METAMKTSLKVMSRIVLIGTLGFTAACSDDDVRDFPTQISMVESLTNGDTDVHSMDVYIDGKAIHLLSGESRPAIDTMSLHYRRSLDGGITWSESVRVDEGSRPPHKPHRGNDVQIAALDDQIVASWTTSGNGFMGSGPLTTVISTDGGLNWHSGPNPADDGTTTGHGFADIVADQQGFHMVWLDSRNEMQGLRYARSDDGGATWSRNATLDAETCECCWNTLISGPGETLYTLYRGKDPRDMMLALAGGAGRWRQLGQVGAFDWRIEACPHAGGGLALLPRDDGLQLHAVVWTGKDDSVGVSHVVSDDGGQSWSKPQQLGDANAAHPDIAATSDGKIAVVWDGLVGKEPASAVLATISGDGGDPWSPVWRLSAPGAKASHPRIIASGGKFKVFWSQAADNQQQSLVTRDIDSVL